MTRRDVVLAIPVAALLLGGAFLFWVLPTPRLERVWKAHMALKAGDRSELDRQVQADLQALLDDYPDLAAAMTEDGTSGIISPNRAGRVHEQHVYLVRTAASQSRLRLRYAYPRKSAVVEVRGRGRGHETSGVLKPNKAFYWDLPPSGALPELIELQIVERTKKGKDRTPSVQIDWVAEGGS